jgi:hypothetical protein
MHKYIIAQERREITFLSPLATVVATNPPKKIKVARKLLTDYIYYKPQPTVSASSDSELINSQVFRSQADCARHSTPVPGVSPAPPYQ